MFNQDFLKEVSLKTIVDDLITDHGLVKAITKSEKILQDYYLVDASDELVESQEAIVNECSNRLDAFIEEQKTLNSALDKRINKKSGIS